MVFEYMDHDLTGLSERPGMKFTIPQIKVSLGELWLLSYAIVCREDRHCCIRLLGISGAGSLTILQALEQAS